MRLFLQMLLAATLAVSCASGPERAGGYTVVREPGRQAVGARIQSLSSLRNDSTVLLAGASYRSRLIRQVDSVSHPVTLSEGERFYDNIIHLTLTGPRGKVLDRDFTRENFRDLVDEPFYSRCILEGMLLEKVEGNAVVYSFGLSDPQSDIYVPFRVTVSSQGQVRIEKGVLMEDLDDMALTQGKDSIQ